jgi:hypothetical protein
MTITEIPFTTKQFLQVFEKYNQAIYPIQFALILIAIVQHNLTPKTAQIL